MNADVITFTKHCDNCQSFALIIHSPTELLSAISSLYPFMKLAIDVVRPLPVASRQRKFILLIIDYYSKWVETEAFALIKKVEVERFVWNEVIYRFKLPEEIISDNITQFIYDLFQDFCDR